MPPLFYCKECAADRPFQNLRQCRRQTPFDFEQLRNNLICDDCYRTHLPCDNLYHDSPLLALKKLKADDIEAFKGRLLTFFQETGRLLEDLELRRAIYNSEADRWERAAASEVDELLAVLDTNAISQQIVEEVAHLSSLAAQLAQGSTPDAPPAYSLPQPARINETVQRASRSEQPAPSRERLPVVAQPVQPVQQVQAAQPNQSAPPDRSRARRAQTPTSSARPTRSLSRASRRSYRDLRSADDDDDARSETNTVCTGIETRIGYRYDILPLKKQQSAPRRRPPIQTNFLSPNGLQNGQLFFTLKNMTSETCLIRFLITDPYNAQLDFPQMGLQEERRFYKNSFELAGERETSPIVVAFDEDKLADYARKGDDHFAFVKIRMMGQADKVGDWVFFQWSIRCDWNAQWQKWIPTFTLCRNFRDHHSDRHRLKKYK
ncbi:unnamed protein product, partial [Mesorhabditis spiculigera]